jgi:hypothetical protein
MCAPSSSVVGLNHEMQAQFACPQKQAGEAVQRAIASGKLWQKLQIMLPVDQCQDNYLDIEPRFNLLLFCDSSEIGCLPGFCKGVNCM